MNTAADYLKTQAGSLDLHAILRQPPSALLGISTAAEQALAGIEIKSVFDLALSRVFSNATLLLAAGISQRDPITGFGAPPTDAVDEAIAGVAVEEYRRKPIEILDGIGAAHAAALEAALDVHTVRDLALWPPYLAARDVLTQAFFPDLLEGSDAEAPADLLPRSGEYPTERIQYSTLVLDEIEDDPAQLTPLGDAGPIDLTPATSADFGFKNPGVGALLTFDQSWYAQGVALGHLLHSVALAPGESTRIAMVDWSRRTRASTAEALSESESLDNATQHSRALSEVQQAVATEAQSGFSKSTAHSSSEEAGGGAGFSLGPITLGGSASGASSDTTAESFSSSYGRRDLEASMTQNVMDRTQQHATAVRNRRASIVREVSQSEHEEASTRVVANYNHMHALSVQYYEVIQIYRVTVRMSKVEKALFIPMKLLDFKNPAIVDKYRLFLASVALGERIRRLLTTEYGVVSITPSVPRPSAATIASTLATAKLVGVANLSMTSRVSAAAAAAPADEPAESAKVMSMVAPMSAASSIAGPAAAMSATLTNVNAAAALRGWDLMQISDISRIVDRAVIRAGADELTLPEDVALLGFFLRDAQLGQARLELDDGSSQALSVGGGVATVATPVGISEVASISLNNPSDKDVRATLVLQLDYLGRRFSLDVPIAMRANQSLGKVATFGATKASKELIEHLEANRLHYSQAVFRRLDASTIALLLSPYKYEGLPVTQLIDPLPIATPGNFLVFRMHPDASTDAAMENHDGPTPAAAWQKWLKDHNISMSNVREEIVPLPSGGVFAEAVLGRFNAAEKLDITRFWNWQDSPIPLQPTEIAPIQMASRAQPENLVPGQFSQPLVNIVNPTSLPDPAGLGAVLGAIQNGNMFRDMSGLAATIGLARAGLEATSEGAGRAGAQAGANLVTAAQKEVEMAKTAVAAMQAMMGNPNGQSGSGANISAQGAKINQGKSMDDRGVHGGNAGDTPAGGGAATAPAGGSGGTSSGGSSDDQQDAVPAGSGGGANGGSGGSGGTPDWMPESYEASAFDAMNWGGLGAPGRLMLASLPGSTAATAQGSASSAAALKIVQDAANTAVPAADRAKAAVQAILDEWYSGTKALVSGIDYSAGEGGLATTSVGSGQATTGKITVGDNFLTGVTESFMARRVIQVGHELQHIQQWRDGMTGAAKKDEREFLAHRWGAMHSTPTGCREMPAKTRLAMIDGALGYWNCLSSAKQTQYKTEKDDLLAIRPNYDGKNGNAPVAAPSTCIRVA